jgi:hypothetical protein
MKFAILTAYMLFCVQFAKAVDAPTTRPSSQPTTQISPEQAFKDATNPENANWTSALPKGEPWILRYRSVPIKETFAHNTFPGDRFLPNSKVPGSAGTTVLNRAQFIDFGFRREEPITENLAFNIDATGLFAYTGGSGANASGFNLDDHRAANDSRPPRTAGYIYSDADYGFDLAVGMTWSVSKEMYVGALADFTTVFLDSGWDRYSSYVSQSSRELFVPAGGLKIGFRQTKNSVIEATILIGRNGIGYSAGIVWDF